MVGVHQRRPQATIDIWIRDLTRENPALESMALADQMENYFDLDIAIQVRSLLKYDIALMLIKLYKYLSTHIPFFR